MNVTLMADHQTAHVITLIVIANYNTPSTDYLVRAIRSGFGLYT